MENEDTDPSTGGMPGGLDFGQSPFGRLLDLPGIDGPQDIFGGLMGSGEEGGNPFAGGGDAGASGNPFAGGFGGQGGGGNPFGGAGGGGDQGGGNPFGGGMGGDGAGQGGNPFGGGGGNPFGGGGGGDDPGQGGNPFAGGGNPFGGGQPDGGGADGPDGGDQPEQDDRYVWDFGAFGDGSDDRYVWDFSAFDDDANEGDDPDVDVDPDVDAGQEDEDAGDDPDVDVDVPVYASLDEFAQAAGYDDADALLAAAEQVVDEASLPFVSAALSNIETLTGFLGQIDLEEPSQFIDALADYVASVSGGDDPGGGDEEDAGKDDEGDVEMDGGDAEEDDGVGLQVVGAPEPDEGMVVVTGAGPGDQGDDAPAEPEPAGEWDFGGLADDAFVFARHGDEVRIEGGGNKFVVEVRGEGDDGEMGGSSVVVEGGNNQFVIIFDYGGDGGLEVMDGAGGNPFGGGGVDPAAGIFERGSAPDLDDPNYVGGDAYVGPPEDLDTPDAFLLV